MTKIAKAAPISADFGHELMLLHVWADEDREPPWDGELELEDAETESTWSWPSMTKPVRAIPPSSMRTRTSSSA